MAFHLFFVQVTRKLAGAAAGTAAWSTNVGNEHGQVLMSVLTVGEGEALRAMTEGIVRRYELAREPPPTLLYVDRDCCSSMGQPKILSMFAPWTMAVRLDIWHYMRRIASGVTTESHALYGLFMGKLSRCIFAWDPVNVDLLVRAKRAELAEQDVTGLSDEAVQQRLNKKEMALHCRRTTRGVEETTRLIEELIEVFDSDEGKDTLGVPLLDHIEIQKIWAQQKHHVKCIQDPDADVALLYTQTGTQRKGGVELPTYRCARGSTSLESFHLHLHRFMPGDIRTAYESAASHLSLHEYSRFFDLQSPNGLDCGQILYSHKSCSNIIQHNAHEMKKEIVKHLISSESKLSIMIDESTDVSNTRDKISAFIAK